MNFYINTHPSGRLGNFLFWIFTNKDFDKNRDTIFCNTNIKNQLQQLGINIIIDKNNTFNGDYKQEFKLINLENTRKQLTCPKNIYNNIINNIPDIFERTVIHIRRGDYLQLNSIYYILSKEYIKSVYNKYYKGTKVLIVSDDKEWCKLNLSNLCDDIIISPFKNVLEDFFCLTLGKSIICSCSSFSVFASYLNKNEDCVIPYPYYKLEKLREYGEKIIPIWAKRKNIIV